MSTRASRRQALARLLAGLLLAPAAARAGANEPARATDPWWSAAGRPTAALRRAVALLADAADQGLEPADYGAEALTQALRSADEAAPAAGLRAAVTTGLLAALRRYLDDLHGGRLDGRALYKTAGGRWPRAPALASPALSALLAAPTDAAGGGAVSLDAASALAALGTLPAAAWPDLADYAALQPWLPRLRALADHPAWAAALPPAPRAAGAPAAKAPTPGDAWPGWPQVADRLRALGDLPGDTDAAAPMSLPAQALAEALRRFQQRHGLAADAAVGPATRAALEVTPAARAEQVALTLERLRWRPQPEATASRWLEVNLAAFQLRMVERVDGRPSACGTVPVIVGQARGHATPLLLAEVQAIEFSPFWNVPPSIARQELVPQLRRDPGAAARLGYEAVLADGRLAPAADPAVLAEVLAGRARLRQRPGERNALGSIKFVFPNADHIYLHHTPSVGLFERARRDFSHGCVRVQDPVAVAAFLLHDQGDWPAERVRTAMASGQTSTVRLARPVPILIGHETAFVAEGQLQLRADLYGHDAALAARLRQRTPGRPAAS